MFTYKSTDFSAIGFIMVLSARSGKPHPLCFLLVLCSYQGVTKRCRLSCSVADPGCLSRIPDPDFYPSRIPDPGSRIPDTGSKNSNKREGRKKIRYTFLCSHKFYKIENFLSFEMLKKKIWANFHRIIELFIQKIVTKLSKIWVWDPGSEIRDMENNYSGSRIQGSKRHRIRDPDPQHCCAAPNHSQLPFH